MTLLEELRGIVEGGDDGAIDKTVKAFVKAIDKLGDGVASHIKVIGGGARPTHITGKRNGHPFSVSLDEKNGRIRTSVEVDGRLVAGGSPDSDDTPAWMTDAARAIVVNTKAESEIGTLVPEDVAVLGRPLDEAKKKGGTEYRVYPSTTSQDHRKFYTRAEAEKYLKSIEDDSPNAGISEMPIKENLDEATSREVLYSIESTYEDKDGAKKTSKDSWQAKWGKPTKANLEKVAGKFGEGKLLSARLVRANGDVVATYSASKAEAKCECPKCGEMSDDDEKCSECGAAMDEPVEEGATPGARSKGTGFGRSETKKAGEFWDKGSDKAPNRKPEFNKSQRAGKKKHIDAQTRGESISSELESILSEDWS